jgi:3-oxoacyl-[acyl-carrier protein] reductase
VTRPLDGKVALVTGAGRERGIGGAAALVLARRGAAVVVTDLSRPSEASMAGLSTVATDRTSLVALAEEIVDSGGRALAISLDVTNEDEARTAVGETVATFGRIDIVFNNAGTPLGAKPFLELGPRDWALSWGVNVMGIVNLCRHVLPVMQEQRSGSIINNSSLAGLKVLPGYAAYSATKAAVVGLTKALALDFGRYGIRVNAVCPGDIDTQMGDIARRLAAVSVGLEDIDLDEGVPVEQVALRRRGLPEDVADVVAWLASDDAGYVTGAAIPIDGAMPQGL